MKNIVSNICVTLLLAVFVCGVFYLSDKDLSFSSPGQFDENTLKSPELPELPTEMILHELSEEDTEEPVTDKKTQSGDVSDEISEAEPEKALEDFLAETEVSFENTLFIGDSRAEGIAEYAGIEGATFYTASGMSVYTVHKQRRINSLNRRTNLAEILAEKQYERIYVILGINELGYNYDITMERFKELVEELEAAQPSAQIILNANLHVTAKKAAKDVNYNNVSIDRMNEGLAQIAKERGHVYMDVNPVFDDESGALGEAYTLDDTHVLAKYYPMWKEFLTEETRRILAEEAYEKYMEENS